jgi:hypothetical protein
VSDPHVDPLALTLAHSMGAAGAPG